MINVYSELEIPVIDSEESLDSLLCNIEKTNSFDDIYISNENTISIKSQGNIFQLGSRAIQDREMSFLVNKIYGGGNGVGEVNRGSDFDESYEAVDNDFKKTYRYRVNMIGFRGAANANHIRVILRSVRTDALTLSELNIEKEIRDILRPSQGLVLVVGGTGSGKSTTLSAQIRNILEDKNESAVIVEYSAPIETTYHLINKQGSIIFQSQVGKDVPTFARAIRNALRSNPDIIVLGEARDFETVSGAMEASLTGHLVYCTSHANSPGEAVQRMIMTFSEGSRSSAASNLITALRTIVVQRLIPRVGGGMVAARGYISIDTEDRERLLVAGLEKMLIVFNEIIEKNGRSMLADVTRLFEAGEILKEDYLIIKAGES